MIHTVKGFGIVNKGKIDVFLELSCFFNDLADVGNLITGSSAFSKTSLNIWNFTVHILLKSGWRTLSIPLLEWGFPCGSDGKASACNAGDPGLIPGSGRSPREGNGNLLQYCYLENPMDGEAW